MQIVRKTYDWVVSFAYTPYSFWALFLLAFMEASFFPLPPDILLIALCICNTKKSFLYALNASIASVLGGALGYLIGWQFMEIVGRKLILFYGFENQVEYIRVLFSKYDAWAIGIAGFTPIPYKVFTILSGFFKIDFSTFMIASAISRSLRFFLVALLLWSFGEKIQKFINKYFNLLTIVFTILLVGGFVVIKFL